MDFALQGSYNYVYLAISELYVELYSSLANELNLFRVYIYEGEFYVDLFMEWFSFFEQEFLHVGCNRFC